MTRLSLVLLAVFGLIGLQLGAAQTPATLDDRVASLETRVAFLEATWTIPITPAPTPTLTVTPTTTATVVPSLTPTASSTPSPSPSPTEEPTPTVAVVSTPTSPPATATPAPVAGQECPVWVHARATASGPDGRSYPTWHPQVDPEFGCHFAHEHGDDPRLSRANPTLPAFGYIGLLIGDDEPHAGFKVFVQNAGSVNEDGRTLAHDARLVVHMGTANPKRFTTRFHSLQYDFIARDGSGHEAHVMGMADTFSPSGICEPRLPKTVMLIPGLCATTSPYEIWSTRLDVGGRFEVNTAWGVFDPITIMDPADPTRLLFMRDYYPQYGSNPTGTKREGYACPCYYANGSGGGLVTFRTDAYGALQADGPLVQQVSRHTDLGVTSMYVVRNSSDVQTQAKLASHQPSATIRYPN